MSSSSSVASLGGGSGWEEQLLNAKITCLNQDGRIKAHFQLDQNTEMAEEYDTRNGQLLLRKWRRKSTLGGAPKAWDYEIGEDALKSVSSSELPGGNTLDLYESNSNPICVARNTKDNFEWRIRNLPYPLEVYDVNVNTEENRIVVRTSNKKYFKKLPIPSMDRIGVKLVQSNVRFAHRNL
ncbi:protein DPCD-like isoform X2 [Convolutriloba macropyga]|uniref:protein DPCD-like isoform X2 n=1 Tax=Convolutriloba macropyga TaxID=536237 RepID=UPI003F522DEF